MTPQEYQLLQDFLKQLTQARGTVKDTAAEALIAKAITEQPDAAYLLVQRTMLLEQALNNAKAQIAQLQNPTGSPASSGSFLSSSTWGHTQTPVAPPPPSSPAYTSAPPTVRPGFLGSGAGSFLGNVAATAAGVAGGAFLFQGIENLLGHHNGGLFGQDTANEKLVESTTVNNYYTNEEAPAALADNIDASLIDSGFDDNINDDSS